MTDAVKKTRRSGPRPSARGPRPHVWRSGPDRVAHEQYTAWLKHRAQANYRSEHYELTFQDWQQLWQGCWFERGRSGDSLCLTMREKALGWRCSNVEIITRNEQVRRQCQLNRGKTYKKKAHYDEQLS